MHQSSCQVEEALVLAQQQAVALFDAMETRGFIHAGQTERELSDRVYRLADELLGIRKYWHKRIVRTGPNTIHPYVENPPDLTIQPDDILFFDFGPIFEQFEADFGRTYVLGGDPQKQRLRDNLLPIFEQGKVHYQSNPAMSGAELYQYIVGLAESAGWHFGHTHCGHLIGEFPHERRLGEGRENYICADNPRPMNTPDAHGEPRHWILEIHLLNPERTWGGFYEDLLTLSRPKAVLS